MACTELLPLLDKDHIFSPSKLLPDEIGAVTDHDNLSGHTCLLERIEEHTQSLAVRKRGRVLWADQTAFGYPFPAAITIAVRCFIDFPFFTPVFSAFCAERRAAKRYYDRSVASRLETPVVA